MTDATGTVAPTAPPDPGPRTTAAPEPARLGLAGRLVDSQFSPIVFTIVLLVLLLWIGSLVSDPFVFPPLDRIAGSVWQVLTEQWGDMALTLVRFAAALAAAMVFGWALGLLMGAFRRTIGRFVNPLVAVVQAVPALSWVLLAILWMEVVETRIAFVTFMIAFPFFVIAVYEGIRDMDKDVLEAIEQFRPSRLQVLRILLLPQSVVNVIMTFRATAAMTLKLMVFAELIAADSGIGHRLQVAQSNFRVDAILAWTLLLVVANFLILWATDRVEKLALKWRAEAIVR
ncbi:ABC transporter permease [Terrabacter aerolatus]|uniref:ABC transporter permease n=1 Tax=Terrabacter aerolatus TaxID=422442 RepID=A0A512D4Y7_9MICO|nr:ABC transporter permease subunit [Terrabacter aerolatus]GEO31533.1 ABC transporter permease [Terrabacter aerolatus]